MEFLVSAEALNEHRDTLIINNETAKEDLYETFTILSDNEGEFSVEDVASGKYDEKFFIPEDFPVNAGFFHIGKWLKLDINNQSNKDDWLIEFAFPLIFTIDIYTEDDSGINQVIASGAKYPFENRLFDHRHFIYELDVKQGEQKSFYVFIEGGADLHPPIKIWDKDEFIKFSNKEIAFIGLFYGMIFVMILYNAFLFIATRMKSYLYYVLAISATTLGQMSLNGIGFKYLWPKFPDWNIIAVPFWVSISCILILFFTREFLNTKKHEPIFQKLLIRLVSLNLLTVAILFFYHYIALNMMFFVSFLTFTAVIGVAIYCLYKGVREARFFLVGWVVFLTGVFITILERASILPYSLFTEYAGQGALVVEVVLLSIALADKINMMRQEKSNAEKLARENQQLAIDNLKKADELKNEFLAITSHELRTPLYGMIGIAESLKEGIGGELSSEVQKQLDIIILSGHRLTHIINDILNFSKLKHHQVRIYPEQVNLKQLSSVVFAICQPLVNENEVTLINDIPDNLSDVLADQNRLQQILYNLIGNAIKFTKFGEIRVSAHIENDKVLIQISDTGKGMEAEELNRIFDPFTQGDDAHSRRFAGTGIGLNVTKRLVELHNSELKVESQIGEGSVFSFTLPLAGRRLEKAKKPIDVMKAMMAKDTALIKPKQLQKQTGPKVLVADDEKVNLQVLINQLSIEGFDVVTVTNGIEVLQEVESQSFDVVILDIMIPKVAGFDVCERLRKSHSLLELPILMLTAKDQLQDKIIAFEAGANDYLTKPCHKDELISRVRTLAHLKWMNEELEMLNVELEDKVEQRTEALDRKSVVKGT